jgi:hypothetical protein
LEIKKNSFYIILEVDKQQELENEFCQTVENALRAYLVANNSTTTHMDCKVLRWKI